MRHPNSMDSCMDVTFMRQPENFENVAHRREDAEEAAKQSPRLQAPAAPTPSAHSSGAPSDGTSHELQGSLHGSLHNLSMLGGCPKSSTAFARSASGTADGANVPGSE